MNLANKLTLFRILLVPLIVIIPLLPIYGAVPVLNIPIIFLIINIIFVIASITDKLDGQIARSRNQVTNFGKFADPLADKILVIATMVVLVEFGHLPAWIPVIVLFREFVVSGYRLVAVEQGGEVIAASIWGKIKTVTQMLAIILLLMDANPFGACFTGILTGPALALNIASTGMMIIQVVATIFSGYDYVKGGKDLLKS